MQIFPRRANRLPVLTLAGLGVAALAVTLGAWYWLSPEFYEVGYQPESGSPEARLADYLRPRDWLAEAGQ